MAALSAVTMTSFISIRLFTKSIGSSERRVTKSVAPVLIGTIPLLASHIVTGAASPAFLTHSNSLVTTLNLLSALPAITSDQEVSPPRTVVDTLRSSLAARSKFVKSTLGLSAAIVSEYSYTSPSL